MSLGLCSVLCLFQSSGIGGLALRCPLAYNPAPHPARGRLVSSPSGTLSIAPVFDTGISKCRPARPRATSDVVHRLACHAGVPVSFIVPSGRRLFFVNSRRLYVSVTARPPLSSSITPASYAGLLLLLPLSGECHLPLSSFSLHFLLPFSSFPSFFLILSSIFIPKSLHIPFFCCTFAPSFDSVNSRRSPDGRPTVTRRWTDYQMTTE